MAAATEAQVSLLDAHLTEEERALLAECEELATESSPRSPTPTRRRATGRSSTAT